LRTPLMLTQTLLQVALADPAISLESLRAACEEVIDVGKEQAQLIEALLTLARSQRGLEHKEPVDLAAVTSEVLHAREPAAVAKGLQVDAALSDALIIGDARLVYSLVSNLVDNAIRHNIAGGHLRITVADSAAGATLSVTNTGPRMQPDQIDRLLQPFQRGRPDRTASPDGLGLGLSIVAAIVTAHGADFSLLPGDTGGLDVEVHFGRPPADDANVATRNGRHPTSKRQAASL
jgi:signal transduction histidine kinase